MRFKALKIILVILIHVLIYLVWSVGMPVFVVHESDDKTDAGMLEQ